MKIMGLSTSKNRALKIMIGLLTIIILLHFCIFAQIIPYNIAWGGRLKNDTQMYIFEILSILMNGLLITVLLLKANYLQYKISEKVLNGFLWFFIILFALNTVGNLFAKTYFEKFFAVLTIIFAVLIWIIVKKRN